MFDVKWTENVYFNSLFFLNNKVLGKQYCKYWMCSSLYFLFYFCLTLLFIGVFLHHFPERCLHVTISHVGGNGCEPRDPASGPANNRHIVTRVKQGVSDKNITRTFGLDRFHTPWYDRSIRDLRHFLAGLDNVTYQIPLSVTI